MTERSYLNAVATGYDAGLAQAPLLHNPEQARQEINQAIATATKGQIPQLLAPGMLQNIGWVLTDALYMHAAWATPFDVNQTSPGPFTTAAGPHVTAQFMTGGEFTAVRAGGWTAVWLPYSGGKLAMEALLPPAGDGRLHDAGRGGPRHDDIPPGGRPARRTDQERRVSEGEPRHPRQHEVHAH